MKWLAVPRRLMGARAAWCSLSEGGAVMTLVPWNRWNGESGDSASMYEVEAAAG